MEILFLMVLASFSLAVIFLAIFIFSARKGQFDDDFAPAVRMLLDDELIDNQKDKPNIESVKN